MKKLGFLLLLVSSSLFSCEKDYTCLCVYEKEGQEPEETYSSFSAQPRDAESTCKAQMKTTDGEVSCDLVKE
jgi:hypothetical protein